MKPVTRWVMNRNEFLPFDKSKVPPLEPVLDVKSRTEEDEPTDEIFDWYDNIMAQTSYFCISNTNRRTIKKGEQAFNSYGSCTNKYWLTTYGFCLEDSPFDAQLVYLQMRANSSSKPDDMVSFIPPAPNDWRTHVQKAKLKCNKIC